MILDIQYCFEIYTLCLNSERKFGTEAEELPAPAIKLGEDEVFLGIDDVVIGAGEFDEFSSVTRLKTMEAVPGVVFVGFGAE